MANEDVVVQATKYEAIGEIASDQETPNFEGFVFKAYHDKFVSPGSFVAVEISRDRFLLGRISGAYENNPHFSPEKLGVKHALNAKPEHPDEKLSFSIFRLYWVETTDEVQLEGNVPVMRPVSTMPKAGAIVIIPPIDFIYASLGLKGDTEEGLNLGTISSSVENETIVPVVLDRRVIQRHVFIGGTTGGGKSYSAKVLAEELHRHNLPIIFFDTQDEFSALTQALNGTILTPGTNYQVRLSSLEADEVEALIPSISNELHVNILINSFMNLRQSNPNFGVGDLVTEIRRTADQWQASKSADIIVPRVQLQLGSYNFIGNSFDWNAVMQPGTVININCRGVSRQRLQLILASTLRELQTLRKSNQILPYVFFIDEAHLFVPQDEDSACRQIITEGVRIGRHYGISFVLITQSPIDIDKKVIRQCNTRLLFAIEPDQLIALQGVKSDASEDMLNRLPKSPVGTCILSGTYETVRRAVPIRIRQMNTQNADGGATPNIFTEVSGDV